MIEDILAFFGADIGQDWPKISKIDCKITNFHLWFLKLFPIVYEWLEIPKIRPKTKSLNFLSEPLLSQIIYIYPSGQVKIYGAGTIDRGQKLFFDIWGQWLFADKKRLTNTFLSDKWFSPKPASLLLYKEWLAFHTYTWHCKPGAASTLNKCCVPSWSQTSVIDTRNNEHRDDL